VDTRYELVSFESHGEFYLVQFAINGALAEAFWEHKSSREDYRTEDAFMSHLRSRALSLYDQFGDIRLRGPIEEIRYGQAA
jgi:hypothetical protein